MFIPCLVCFCLVILCCCPQIWLTWSISAPAQKQTTANVLECRRPLWYRASILVWLSDCRRNLLSVPHKQVLLVKFQLFVCEGWTSYPWQIKTCQGKVHKSKFCYVTRFSMETGLSPPPRCTHPQAYVASVSAGFPRAHRCFGCFNFCLAKAAKDAWKRVSKRAKNKQTNKKHGKDCFTGHRPHAHVVTDGKQRTWTFHTRTTQLLLDHTVSFPEEQVLLLVSKRESMPSSYEFSMIAFLLNEEQVNFSSKCCTDYIAWQIKWDAPFKQFSPFPQICTGVPTEFSLGMNEITLNIFRTYLLVVIDDIHPIRCFAR